MKLLKTLAVSSAVAGLVWLGRALTFSAGSTRLRKDINNGEASLDEFSIRELALQIWENEGRPEGQETRHWYMAVRLLKNNLANALYCDVRHRNTGV